MYTLHTCIIDDGQNMTSAALDNDSAGRRYVVLTFWDSQVAVVGIGLCTGVILASLSFVCYQRLALRRLRAKQDTQTPAYRVQFYQSTILPFYHCVIASLLSGSTSSTQADTQTPAYRALVASKQKQTDADLAAVKPGQMMMMMTGTGGTRLQPRSPRVTGSTVHHPSTRSSDPHTAAAAASVKLFTASPVRQRTPASTHRLTTTSPVTSGRTAAAQLSIFTPVCRHESSAAALRSSRGRSKSPREAFECVCLGGVGDTSSFMLETRPPVEGRDSLSVEQVLDTAASDQKIEASYGGVELKTASYVAPTTCSVAVRRSLERVEQVTRGTSPMSTSDVDVLPDISGLLLTSGTETDDVDDVQTMTGGPSSSSLSDLVASCDAEFDSDECSPSQHGPPTHTTTPASVAAASDQRLHLKASSAWTRKTWAARRRQRNAMLEPDVYYC